MYTISTVHNPDKQNNADPLISKQIDKLSRLKIKV